MVDGYGVLIGIGEKGGGENILANVFYRLVFGIIGSAGAVEVY